MDSRLIMLLPIALTVAACLIASYFDVRARRIPNVLTGSLAAAALLVHGVEGLRPLGVTIAVMASLMAVGTLIYARGGIGGGDVKLAAAASGMLSYPLLVPFLLYTAIGGGFLAVAFLAARGKGNPVPRAVLMTVMGAPGLAATKIESMPYAVAFAFGAILLALSQSVAPFLRITL